MTSLNIKTIYEDDSLLVLEKPSGIVVNNSKTTTDETIQDFLYEKLGKELDGADKESEFYKRAGLAHRLDKETSGILLVAKNVESLEDLQVQFKERKVEKEYTALVIGDLKEKNTRVDAPLARNPRHRTKMAVVIDGKSAITDIYKVKELEFEGDYLTLITAKPLTGRTHQIRVHLAALEHPIAGDSLYSGRKRSAKYRENFGRLMLHASKITFTHPKTHEKLTFKSKLPEEFNF